MLQEAYFLHWCCDIYALTSLRHWRHYRQQQQNVVSGSRKRRGLRWSDARYSEQRALPRPGHWTHKTAAARFHRQPIKRRRLEDDATSGHHARAQLCWLQGPATDSQRVALRRTGHRLLWIQGLTIVSLATTLRQLSTLTAPPPRLCN